IIRTFVDDFVPVPPIPSYLSATPAGCARRRSDESLAKGAGNRHFLAPRKQNPCKWLELEVPVDEIVLLEAPEALPDLPRPHRPDPGDRLEVALGRPQDRLQPVHVRHDLPDHLFG